MQYRFAVNFGTLITYIEINIFMLVSLSDESPHTPDSSQHIITLFANVQRMANTSIKVEIFIYKKYNLSYEDFKAMFKEMISPLIYPPINPAVRRW